jgi:hypothetical protein
VKKLIGLLGWLGLALVVAALVLWMAKPDWESTRRGRALSSPQSTPRVSGATSPDRSAAAARGTARWRPAASWCSWVFSSR